MKLPELDRFEKILLGVAISFLGLIACLAYADYRLRAECLRSGGEMCGSDCRRAKP